MSMLEGLHIGKPKDVFGNDIEVHQEYTQDPGWSVNAGVFDQYRSLMINCENAGHRKSFQIFVI